MALKVTYWKDSSLIDRDHGIPAFPVCFTFAHFQNIAGLRAAQRLVPEVDLTTTIEAMVKGIHTLFDPNKGQFAIARDGQGDVFAISDDFLHGLYYLMPGDLTQVELKFIMATAKALETDFGFRTNSSDRCDLNDKYHTCTLWPFEQGFIDMGATKFGLAEIGDIASRIAQSLDTLPEFCYIDSDGKILEPAGNNPQLWTGAVKTYFENLV
jgi:hypothetical protein